MPFYMIQAAYQAQGLEGLVRHPHDREQAIRPAVEGLGGKIHGLWFAFGEYDIVGIFEMPDNVSIAAFMLAAGANPAVKAIRTTALLTIEESIAAMQRAPRVGYRPPTE